MAANCDPGCFLGECDICDHAREYNLPEGTITDISIRNAISNDDVASFSRIVQRYIEERGIEVLKDIYLSNQRYLFNNQNFECLKHIFSRGLSVEVLNRDRCTPLMESIIHYDRLTIVDYLLSIGADPNVEMYSGSTCLYNAIFIWNNFEIAKMLLENGADPNQMINFRTQDKKMTLLHAILRGSKEGRIFFKEESIILLLQYGASIEILDSDGKKPIEVAGLSHKERVQKLVEKYYSPEMKEPDCC